jgi:hypothetical protein
MYKIVIPKYHRDGYVEWQHSASVCAEAGMELEVLQQCLTSRIDMWENHVPEVQAFFAVIMYDFHHLL